MKITIFEHVSDNTFKLISESTKKQRMAVIASANQIAKKLWGNDININFHSLNDDYYKFQIQLPSKVEAPAGATSDYHDFEKSGGANQGHGDSFFNFLTQPGKPKEKTEKWLIYNGKENKWFWADAFSGTKLNPVQV